jgi:hypothetical protein
MAENADHGPDEAGGPLEIELRLVREAVWMVASGAARRVVLAGLRFANDLLGSAGEAVLEPGVRLRPLWRRDESGVDIAVEGISGSPGVPDRVLGLGVAEPSR